MAEYLIQSESLIKIANEIRELSGTTEAMGLDAMTSNVGAANDTVNSQASIIAQIVSALEGKAAGGGSGANENEIIAEFLETDPTIIENSIVTKIRPNAFCNCSSLTSVNFPACTTIGIYAFYSCSKLTSINFPVCTSISNYAFYGCRNLTTASFPKCTTIDIRAFEECAYLTTVSFPVCTVIDGGAFEDCSSLTSVNFPKCTTIDDGIFTDCSNLTTVSFPVCTSIGSSTFFNCSKLTTVSFPVCTSIGNYAFYSCRSLRSISFPACNIIDDHAFEKCYTLSSLTLGASTVCTLSNSNAFSSTPYAGYSSYFSGTPYIYVPASLVDAYKSATNWTYFANYIVEIGYVADDNNSSPEEDDLITFKIENDEYQAQKGMTWAELLASDYSPDDEWKILNTKVFCGGGVYIAYNGIIVLGTDTVIDQGAYEFYYS